MTGLKASLRARRAAATRYHREYLAVASARQQDKLPTVAGEFAPNEKVVIVGDDGVRMFGRVVRRELDGTYAVNYMLSPVQKRYTEAQLRRWNNRPAPRTQALLPPPPAPPLLPPVVSTPALPPITGDMWGWIAPGYNWMSPA